MATFTFTSGPGFGSGGTHTRFTPMDPQKIFEYVYLTINPKCLLFPGNFSAQAMCLNFGNMGGFPHGSAFSSNQDDDMNGSYTIFTDGGGHTF